MVPLFPEPPRRGIPVKNGEEPHPDHRYQNGETALGGDHRTQYDER